MKVTWELEISAENAKEAALLAFKAMKQAARNHDTVIKVDGDPLVIRECRGFASLTVKERQIVELLVEGLTVKEIAVRLDNSVKTISVHKNNLFKKLGVHSSVRLVRDFIMWQHNIESKHAIA